MEPKLSTREEYLKRINLVVEYINNNLDSELDLNKLADMACFSPYHFHRIIKAFLGEPIGSFITRMRVETAARLLRYTANPIEEIAYSVGYASPSSLSKAFKLFYNISPIDYRNNKDFTIVNRMHFTSGIQLKKPKIETIPNRTVLYIRIVGEYGNVDYGKAWERLWAIIKEQKLFTAGIEHIGISHDDPKVTESNKCRYDACLVIHKPAQAQGEIGIKDIPGGRYAVFLYKGPYQQLSNVYDAIFGKWLPESSYELRNVPAFEKYINNPTNAEAEKLKTEIYIPIV